MSESQPTDAEAESQIGIYAAVAAGGAVVLYLLLFLAARGRLWRLQHCQECGRGIFGLDLPKELKGGGHVHGDEIDDCHVPRWYDTFFGLPYYSTPRWYTGLMWLGSMSSRIKDKRAARISRRFESTSSRA